VEESPKRLLFRGRHDDDLHSKDFNHKSKAPVAWDWLGSKTLIAFRHPCEYIPLPRFQLCKRLSSATPPGRSELVLCLSERCQERGLLMDKWFLLSFTALEVQLQQVRDRELLSILEIGDMPMIYTHAADGAHTCAYVFSVLCSHSVHRNQQTSTKDTSEYRSNFTASGKVHSLRNTSYSTSAPGPEPKACRHFPA
jgi:hypothetical protein